MEKNFNSKILGKAMGNMNIGPDGKMQATPEMLDALGVSYEDVAKGEAKSDGIAYKEVKLSSIEPRPITSLEYDLLPSVSRKGIRNVITLSYLFTIVVLAAIAAFAYKIAIEAGVDKTCIWLGGLIIVLVFILATVKRAMRGISAKSNVIKGNVLFITTREMHTNNRRILYYVTVSLPEKKQCIKSVKCDFKSLGKLKIGSPVFICNKRVYPAE